MHEIFVHLCVDLSILSTTYEFVPAINNHYSLILIVFDKKLPVNML